MRVYIVTAGSYSDYHIKRVFAEEEKAKAYLRFCPDGEIEEYETDDKIEFVPFRVASMQYTIYYFGDVDFSLNTYWKNEQESSKEIEEFAYYYDDPGRYKRLCIRRVITSDKEDYELEEKYRRVCEDLMAQIQSLIETEGWTSEMVDEWLKDRGRLTE